jgi:hypothetical protein
LMYHYQFWGLNNNLEIFSDSCKDRKGKSVI